MDPGRHLLGEMTLRMTSLRGLAQELSRFSFGKIAEAQEKHLDVVVRRVHPELEEVERARALGIQPDVLAATLAELLAVGFEKEWPGKAKASSALMTLHEPKAAQDVAPLIATSDLELATVTLAQDLEVLRLQQRVGELSKREAFFIASGLTTQLDRILVEQGVHGEVNTDFTKKIDDLEPREPLTVIDELRRGLERSRGKQSNNLCPQTFDVAVDVTRRKEDAIRPSTRGVSDEPRCSTDENDGRVPRLLKAPEHPQRQEMTDVE